MEHIWETYMDKFHMGAIWHCYWGLQLHVYKQWWIHKMFHWCVTASHAVCFVQCRPTWNGVLD